MSALEPDPAKLRYVLRGVPPDRAATWLVSDGETYYAPKDAAAFPVEDPGALAAVWGARASAERTIMGSPLVASCVRMIRASA